MKQTEPILAPSILAADYTKLGEEIKTVTNAGAQWIHCDVMDGHFVPNISYGAIIVDAAKKSSNAFLDVHLMIYNPDMYVHEFVKAGADLISVHIEAVPHIHRSIQLIKSLGVKAGVAINPGTSLSALESILPDVDLVVLMSVNPGFGGQKFIESTYERIASLHAMRHQLGLHFQIEIDGGVGLNNIEKVSRSGADIFVAGSAVFGAENQPERVGELLKLAQKGKSFVV